MGNSLNQGFKKDRHTEGLEMDEADLGNTEFNQMFKQYEQDESNAESEIINDENNFEIEDFKILYREDTEYTHLAILYIDQEPNSCPILFAARGKKDTNDKDEDNRPIRLENIHGVDAYKIYLMQEWTDITEDENAYPWEIKSLLAMHMKQDTIKSRS